MLLANSFLKKKKNEKKQKNPHTKSQARADIKYLNSGECFHLWKFIFDSKQYLSNLQMQKETSYKLLLRNKTVH